MNVHKYADGASSVRYAACSNANKALSSENMQEYRLYVFEAGRLLSPCEFHASDDEGAIEIAEQNWKEGRQMELWAYGRQVRCWGFPNSSRPQDR